MSIFEFRLPDIGEGVTEGEVVEWHVAPGDQVAEDDPMVEVMTDKATVTIGAPRTGTISALRCEVGGIAQVGEVLVVIEQAGPASEAPPPRPVAPAAPSPATSPRPRPPAGQGGPAATAVGDIREGLPGSSYFRGRPTMPATGGNGASAEAPAPPSGHLDAKPLATPATRKLARDLDVDLRQIRPSGKGGRVTVEDVRGFAAGAPTRQAPIPAQAGVPSRAAPVAVAPGSEEERALEDRRPFVGIRRKIAARMQTAKNTAAHFTFVEECDVGRLIELRGRMRPAAEEAGVRLSYLPFVVKAVVAALKKHAILNSALDESTNELVHRRYYHVGIAAATDQGLMVPVLRDADRMSILDVAREIDRLGDGARAGTLEPHELSGSTFTITSLGRQGGLFATPILNFPEVGILGVHQMKRKPVVRGEEIVIGDVMLLSLSFDHRIVDGHVGAAFAYDIIANLENPERLFLEMV